MKKFLRSFVYAFKGIRFAWRGRNFRIQLLIAVLVIVSGLYVGITPTEWLAFIVITGLVLSLEVINTAIENLVNLAMPQYHPLAGKIKDLSAGAVLIISITAVVVGMAIFYKYLPFG